MIGFISVFIFNNLYIQEFAIQTSAALAYSTVSIRILIPIAVVTDFEIGYAIATWLSWTINLLILFILRIIYRKKPT